MPRSHSPVLHEGCPVILYSHYFYYGCLLALFFIIVCHSCTFPAVNPFTPAGASHQIVKDEMWFKKKKTPVPLRLLPYLYATPILLFNLMHFKVTKIATCSTAACVRLVKKDPTKWIGHAEGDSDKQTEKTQTTVSGLRKIMAFNVVAINLWNLESESIIQRKMQWASYLLLVLLGTRINITNCEHYKSVFWPNRQACWLCVV